MHSRVYLEFERICAARPITGSVLEIGAVPSDESLLRMKAMQNAKEKIGLNLDGPYEYADLRIVQGNGNHMDSFEDNRFDVVLCNAVLEHDKFFWKTLSEIRRVAKPGALVVIGTPGYTRYRLEKIRSFVLNRIPLLRSLKRNQYLNMFFTATITLQVHNAPGDYYRFSPQAYKEIFFEGLNEVEVTSVMLPPRLIGWGYMPSA